MTFTEDSFIELKLKVTNDICKEIIAFANTSGGTIYIGVNDNGEIVGLENVDNTILQVNNMIHDTIKPDVTMFIRYETLTINNKNIVSLIIQKGTNRPYYLVNKGLKPSGVYVRNGTSTDPATDLAIRQMIKETDGDSFEDLRSLNQNLTFEKAQLHFQQRGLSLNQQNMKTLGMINEDNLFTNVALLLSDQCPQTIKAATFTGTDKTEFQDRKEFKGSLFQQMEDAYAYLDLRNRTKATINGLYRIDKRDYPEEALREALLNFLVHRDYSLQASTLMNIYDDRVELISIGGLPSGICLEDIMLGLSICRNPKLAAIFYRLKLIEAYGTGIPKIIRAYKQSDKKPQIEATPNAFKIVLPNLNMEGDKDIDQAFTNINHEKILKLLSEKDFVVRNDIDDILGTSPATSLRILKEMMESGQLSRQGTGKKTKYSLSNR